MRQADFLNLLNAFHSQMVRGADAARGISQPARIGARIGKQILPGLQMAIGLDGGAEQPAGHADDMREIANRVPAGCAHHPGPTQHGKMHLGQRIAIGPRLLRHGKHPKRATSARAVLHYHRLAKRPADQFGDGTQLCIGGTAGGPGHHKLDGPFRVAPLRQGKARCGQGSAGCGQQGAARNTVVFRHVSSSRARICWRCFWGRIGGKARKTQALIP